MSPETEGYIETLENLCAETRKLLHEMSPEELNWAPLNAETNSPWAIATHIVGSQGFWIHQLIGGMDSHRNREAEFTAQGSDVTELEALLDKAIETTRQVLQSLSSDDLDQIKENHPAQTPMSLRMILLRLIRHISEHLGHLTLTKQLYAASS